MREPSGWEIGQKCIEDVGLARYVRESSPGQEGGHFRWRTDTTEAQVGLLSAALGKIGKEDGLGQKH